MSRMTLNAETLYGELLNRMRGLIASLPQPPLLVGVASGGVWLAERLQQDLALPGTPGVLSSTMHRDDFSRRGMAAGGATQLPFDVNGAHLVLVDDVLFTGRTIRAVLNELFDYGRPASVKLVVLVDRGGRELPVQPDLVMARVSLPAEQSLELARDAQGGFSLEVRQRQTP